MLTIVMSTKNNTLSVHTHDNKLVFEVPMYYRDDNGKLNLGYIKTNQESIGQIRLEDIKIVMK